MIPRQPLKIFAGGLPLCGIGTPRAAKPTPAWASHPFHPGVANPSNGLYEAWIAPVGAAVQLARTCERVYLEAAFQPLQAWTARTETKFANAVRTWAERWNRMLLQARQVPPSDPTLRLRQWEGWSLRAQSAVREWLGSSHWDPERIIGLKNLHEQTR